MYMLNYRAARAILKNPVPKTCGGRVERQRNRSNVLRKRILRSVEILLQCSSHDSHMSIQKLSRIGKRADWRN